MNHDIAPLLLPVATFSPTPGGQRNKDRRRQPKLLQKRGVLRFDLIEAFFIEADQIHLVYRHNDLTNPKQAEQLSMTAALLAHPFVGRDHHHRGIGRRGPRNHVLQKFLVPRRIDNDVIPVSAPKLNLRGIDRDVLFLFLGERVEDKGVLERLSFPFARLANVLDFSGSKRPGVGQNPADQGRFPVINMTNKNDRCRELRIAGPDTGWEEAPLASVSSFIASFRNPKSAIRNHRNPRARSFCMAWGSW